MLKPAESASLTLLHITRPATAAGLPDGVLNVVTGTSPVVGEALGLSMGVDVLVFTGSGATGRRLLDYAARYNLKRVYLELGGKSPNIVFADAPELDRAAKVAASAMFRNAGQVCVAGSRLLVEASIHDEFVRAMAAHAGNMAVGDPLDLGTEVGAIHSADQLEMNLDFVGHAESEGAKRICGGSRILAETGGYFMETTVMASVAPDHRLA